MSKLKSFIVIFLLLTVSATASAQKLEEMKNSYNYQRGMELINASEPDEDGAMGYFKKEVAQHPKNGYAYYQMGLINEKDNQKGNALNNFSKAIEYLKKDKEWVSNAYGKRANINLYLGHDDLALNDWNASLKANPNNINALSDRAEYYSDKDEQDLSDADYDKIIAIEPGNTLGFKGKGRNADCRKEYQKAAGLFSYAISLDPNDDMAYSYRADAYISMGKYHEASDDIVKALTINFNNSTAWNLAVDFEPSAKDIMLTKLRVQQAKDKASGLWAYLQATIYENHHDFANAIKAYKESQDITASDVTLYRISCCYSNLGENEQALDYINRAISINPDEAEDLEYKSLYLYENGQSDDAIAAISAYIEKVPDDYEGYYRRAFYEGNANKTDDAIDDYTTSITLNPQDAYSYLGRADCYKKKGLNDDATADYKKVVELDTTYTENSCAQYALLALGENDKAKAFQDSITARFPDNDESYYGAACLYCRMGEYDKAMSFLRQALEKGYRDFAHINNDEDLDALKQRDDFKALVNELKQKAVILEREESADTAAEATSRKEHVSEIPFTSGSSGLCKVKCSVNGLPLDFLLDTGSSVVMMSEVEAAFMMKNGYLSKDDVIGGHVFVDANGNDNDETIINLKKMTLGEMELTNVRASISKSPKASLLLGQTVLSRLGSVEIDNAKKVIRIKYLK